MRPSTTLLLNREEVNSLLGIDECIPAVEEAFRSHAEAKSVSPAPMELLGRRGGYHIKACIVHGSKEYFLAKLNANFPENMHRFGLPTIQGLIAFYDGDNGYPLVVMDSIDITMKRTGAATAVAAKYLSREDSSIVTICGCGNQGRIQLVSLQGMRPIKKVNAYDIDSEAATRFAREFSHSVNVEPIHRVDLSKAIRTSDVCITCTTSTTPFVHYDDIRPGIFIAAVGADSHEKQELDPKIFAAGKIVVDALEQSASIGDLHHALENGIVKKTDVHAELGEIVAGKKTARLSRDEVTIFDSTGMALQDAAVALIVYKNAVRGHVGTSFNFF